MLFLPTPRRVCQHDQLLKPTAAVRHAMCTRRRISLRLSPAHIDSCCVMCCGCCCSFGLVPIPLEMRAYLVVGTLLVIFLSYMWEHSLRQLFPAGKPPSKGYMVHRQQLRSVTAQQARSKKDL